MTVSELACHLNISADTIRHYVRCGLISPAKDPFNGYKRFSNSDIKRLRFILQAKSLGFSLSDIQTILNQAESGESPCPNVREIMQQRLTETALKIQQMQETYEQMQTAIKRWALQPDCIPTGDHICHLIEGLQNGDCCHE